MEMGQGLLQEKPLRDLVDADGLSFLIARTVLPTFCTISVSYKYVSTGCN